MQQRLFNLWHTDADGSTRIAQFYGVAAQVNSIARTLRMLGYQGVQVTEDESAAANGKANKDGAVTEAETGGAV